MNKRYPSTKLDEAVMRVVACAGYDLVFADDEISDKEPEAYHSILEKYFTDDSAAELLVEAEKRETRLHEAITVINQEGDWNHKKHVITCLVQLAIVDEVFISQESTIIMEIALKLGLKPLLAYSLIFETARECGFGSNNQNNTSLNKNIL